MTIKKPVSSQQHSQIHVGAKKLRPDYKMHLAKPQYYWESGEGRSLAHDADAHNGTQLQASSPLLSQIAASPLLEHKVEKSTLHRAVHLLSDAESVVHECGL